MTFAFANSKMPPVRALLVLCIVLGHFSFYGVPALGAFRCIAPPAVAMFLFISGYGLTRSFRTKGADYLQGFFTRRVFRIVLPALLVVLLHLLLGGGSGMRFFERARAIATHGQTLLPHYWFVWAILFDYLLFWLCRKLLPARIANWAILAGVLLFMAGTAYAGFDRCWWVCALAFPAGAFFADREEAVYGRCGKGEIDFWLALLALGIVGAGLYLTRNVVCWTLCYAVITLFAALVIARLPLDRLRLPVLTWLGGISYELYLVHIPVMAFLRKICGADFSQVLFVAATLALSVLAAFAIRFLCQLATRK